MVTLKDNIISCLFSHDPFWILFGFASGFFPIIWHSVQKIMNGIKLFIKNVVRLIDILLVPANNDILALSDDYDVFILFLNLWKEGLKGKF